MCELLFRIRAWNSRLLSRLQGLLTSQRLEQKSMKLVEFRSSALEVPGQYSNEVASLPVDPIRIVHFQRDVQVMFR